VQNRQAYTGCADVPNPDGMSGRPWCYVESQLADSEAAAWGFCAPVVNYDAARGVAKRVLAAKAQETQGYTAQLHKTQQAAESALDMYRKSCA